MSLADKYMEVTLESYEDQCWTCLNCYCGLCIEGCPAYRELKNEAASARGLAQIALSLLNNEIDINEISDNILYACTGCRWCESICAQNTPKHIQESGNRKTKVSGATITEVIRSVKVEESGKIPSEIRNALDSLMKSGTPYGGGKKKKDNWISSLNIHTDFKDRIVYVGSTVPYEERSTRMAESLIEVLNKAKIQFGMLGSKEMDSGSFARMMGEEGLFMELVDKNMNNFKKYGIKEIICLSPHDYDAFINYYGDITNTIQVSHYTQYLWELIKEEQLSFNNVINMKVTYQDPCYLGRQNGCYDAPRNILKNLPGIHYIELENSKERSFCCGGGGTGLFFDLPDVNMDRSRAQEIVDVKPDCLAVACPICYQMLETSIKSIVMQSDHSNLKNDLQVRDIAELVLERL